LKNQCPAARNIVGNLSDPIAKDATSNGIQRFSVETVKGISVMCFLKNKMACNVVSSD